MIDDLLGAIFAEAVFGRLTKSRRAQLFLRMFSGLLGAGLAAVGAVHFAIRADFTQNLAMRISLFATFAFLACFSLFVVGLGRMWRWPGKLFIASLVALFASRLLFGP
ncbi:MAG: hypothetical protein K8H90_01605 [Thermoanaerobaculia bacterium]|nr:hypothetical protein [Thermoanaerobaculia bacterium]